MKKSNIIWYITCFYFGFALSMFGNINFMMWQFYAIIVPVILGHAIYSEVYSDEQIRE